MTTAAESRPRKPKKCGVCKEEFKPKSPMQKVCGIKCAMAHAEAFRTAEAKRTRAAERKAIREAKQKAKTRGDWQREAQQSFNAFIRERDADLPCISCGRWHDGQHHAGHYLSVGARPNLRFDELNVHKQCSVCNNHLHGNLVNYRRALIAKIGIDAVEGLEADQSVKKYSIQDLQQIKKTYIAKRKSLETAK